MMRRVVALLPLKRVVRRLQLRSWRSLWRVHPASHNVLTLTLVSVALLLEPSAPHKTLVPLRNLDLLHNRCACTSAFQKDNGLLRHPPCNIRVTFVQQNTRAEDQRDVIAAAAAIARQPTICVILARWNASEPKGVRMASTQPRAD